LATRPKWPATLPRDGVTPGPAAPKACQYVAIPLCRERQSPSDDPEIVDRILKGRRLPTLSEKFDVGLTSQQISGVGQLFIPAEKYESCSGL